MTRRLLVAPQRWQGKHAVAARAEVAAVAGNNNTTELRAPEFMARGARRLRGRASARQFMSGGAIAAIAAWRVA